MKNSILHIKYIFIILLAVGIISACDNKMRELEDNTLAVSRFYNTQEETTAEKEAIENITYNEAKEEIIKESELITEESETKVNKKTNTKKTNKKRNSPIPKKCKPVEADYFNDVVFVGDSVSQGLRDYLEWIKKELKIDYVGEAKFLTALNFGIRNALLGKKLPLYHGEQTPIEDAISQMNVKKVYILLGMNDIDAFEIDKIVEYYEELIENILSKKPDLKIFIQSVTPLTRTENKNQTYKNFRQSRVDKLNKKLFNMAKKKGYYYLDIASVVKDKKGFLPNKYSYKETCHMRPEALELWIKYLRTHAIKY